MSDRPTAGGEVRQKPVRELFLIAADGKPQRHANVTPVTLHFGGFDRLGLP